MKAAIGSVVFFVIAPGTVAGLIPWWLTNHWHGSGPLPLRIVGAVFVLCGLAVLVHSFVKFVREGLGTPAPVAPTKHLVVGGLYRFVRNPMYVAIIAIVLGQAMVFGSLPVLWYSLLTWVVPAAFVKLYEEPTLRQTYGAEYEEYCRNVPAWIPRMTPWQRVNK